jgi:hypothetical protein
MGGHYPNASCGPSRCHLDFPWLIWLAKASQRAITTEMSRPPAGWLRAVTVALCGRCRGGGWPGSPGGSTASRWPGWPRCWCLSQHGYTSWTSYQPASRFWPFQWIEGGWLLALSVLLIAATVWLVRRRTT